MSGFGTQGGGNADLAGLQPQTDNDKLLGALCYIFWILIPVIILVTDMKNSRFAKVHAYQGITFGATMFVFSIGYFIFYSIMTSIIWVIGCILWVGFLLPLILSVYIAYKVFTSGQVVFPYLTDITRSLFKDL